jgi:hypothetical protein
MSSYLTKTAGIFLAACALPKISPFVLDAQLVREAAARPAQYSAAAASAQDSVAASTPSGKLRVSQEVQLTGDSSWVDTGIDVQAGEHVVALATGTLRYADQQTDTAPAGIARGFKDLLRNLPFNEAGRGAVIGRIGDKDTSQPFLIGAKRDLVSPISGRLLEGPHSRPTAERFGSAPPPTMSASKKISATTALPTKLIPTSTSSATMSKKPSPPRSGRGSHSRPAERSDAGGQDRYRRQLPLQRPSPSPETRRICSEAVRESGSPEPILGQPLESQEPLR